MQRLLALLGAVALSALPRAAALQLRDANLAAAAELEDARFLRRSYGALELELRQLARLAATPLGSPLTLPTVKAAPAAPAAPPSKKMNNASQPAVAAAATSPVASASALSKKNASSEAAAPSKVEAGSKVAAALKAAGAGALPSSVVNALGTKAKEAMGTAMLAPMLEMLKGLYGEQKKRISEINKREEKSKLRFDEQKKAYEAKMKKLEEEHKSGHLKDEWYKNETRDATHTFKYWERSRDRNHRQFHNSLKLTHATMSKEKTMIDAYEKAMSPKLADKKAGEVEFHKITQQEAPEVVFLQGISLSQFCKDALELVRNGLGALSAHRSSA